MPDGFFPAGRRAALSMSFDDARLSQVDRGMPLLDRLGIRASFYVCSSGVEPRLEQWLAAVARGHEIGNHSLTHPCSGNLPFARGNALEDYTLARMEGDIDAASDWIRENLRVKPTTFAYPCGQTFVGRGEGVCSYVPVVARRFDVGRLFRTEAVNDPRFCDLAQACCHDFDGLTPDAVEGLIDFALAEGAWLVLAGHEINESGNQTTRLDTLEALGRFCDRLREQLWVGTVAEVGSWIRKTR